MPSLQPESSRSTGGRGRRFFRLPECVTEEIARRSKEAVEEVEASFDSLYGGLGALLTKMVRANAMVSTIEEFLEEGREVEDYYVSEMLELKGEIEASLERLQQEETALRRNYLGPRVPALL